MRQMVENNNTICFCSTEMSHELQTCNAGYVILGSKDQLECIANQFNENKFGTEMTELLVVNFQELQQLDSSRLEFNIEYVLSLEKIRQMDPNIYTMIGINAENNNYSFVFGKREWYPNDNIETSVICAKRELYEEFNIQFSQKLEKRSAEKLNLLNLDQYIKMPIFFMTVLYLPREITIDCYQKSKTIYIDLDN
jgi:hypothetical protein